MDITFWLFSFLCLLQLDGGFCACPVEVYSGVRGWGPKCTYRCNCLNNTQCDEETGTCQRSCGDGWMGPACQYRNMASGGTTKNVHQKPGTSIAMYFALNAVDGDITTCSKTGTTYERRYWNADFYSNIYIVGLVLKIKEADASKFRGFTIEAGNTTGSMETCYMHGANDDGSSNMDISCMKPVVGNRIRIYFKEGDTSDLSLCEVEVYGGRLVSFHKTTSIESVLDYSGTWHSYYAVDGRNPKRGENQDNSSVRTCAATNTEGRRHNWLLVDLNNTYSIQAVSFYGRWESPEQFPGFVVRVGDNNDTIFVDDPPNQDAAYYHPKSHNRTWPVDGRTVRIDRMNVSILVVCEIEIFSECTYGKCGWNCDETCVCSGQTTGIHKIQATCPHGCAGRWTGANRTCITECQSHEWGLQCSNVCGNCERNESCSVTNGYCPGSCEPGWKPPMCANVCDSGKYGVNCNKTCGYCKNGRICHRVNGTCLSGCADGYVGHDCQTACSLGSFGHNCSETCGHCLDEEFCHHGNGTCTNGCAAGYQGTYCKEVCDHGKFGLNCANRCGKCRNNVTCNKTSGECDNGCAPGWLTTFCNKTCDEGFYGDSCKETCGHCFNDTSCDPQTGDCETGCAAGYHGTVCKTPCKDGKFGENCRSECGKCAGHDPCIATNGVCAQGCVDGYSGELCQENQVTNGDNQTTIIGAVVGSVVVVTVVILAVVVVVLKRRHKGKGGSSKKKEETEFSNKALVEEADSLTKLHSDPPAQNVSEVEYKNVQDVAKGPGKTIPVNVLRNVCLAAQRNPDFLYKDFQELPYGLHGDASEARNPDYKPKNRYKEMFPYNATRVHLPEIPGCPSSTYINASYIDGYFHPQQYIAAQGALKTTINDIWRMIWSENIKTIVMVTNCVEAGKLKCEQYWPDHDSDVFGDISVELKSTKEYADFKIRTFSCTSTQSNAKRRVTQFHYTAWPDKDVPDTALSIVQFWRVVRDHNSANLKERRPPMLVHCSAGVGRTGTFIATDVLYDQGKAENSVNVKEAVYRLRQQRLNLVQTKEQYVLLHDMLAEILDPIGTVCSCDEFPAIYSTLVSDKAINKQQLFQEYQQVCKACEEVLHDTDEGAVYGNIGAQVLKGCDSAKLPENLKKSRDPGILPEDADRPLLNMEVRGCNDYINAVYLSTYRHQDRMILTQCPLENTVVDFLRMVWQYRITDVVLLEQEMPSQEEPYWSTRENHKTVGPFVIELLSEQSQDIFIFRTIKLSVKGKSEQIEFRQYHYQAWPEKKEIPVDTGSILHLISAVEQNEMTQLVVQCLDGAKRSGVFCVIYSLLERLKLDGQVAVAETVRMAKVKRRQIIDNYEQYKYCYDVVNDCLQTSNVYANV